MNFKITYYRNAGFSVMLARSSEAINYPDMPEGKYDWQKDIIFDSLPVVKKHLRERAREERLSSTERYWINDQIKELTLESIVDEELELYAELEKQNAELKKENAELKKQVAELTSEPERVGA